MSGCFDVVHTQDCRCDFVVKQSLTDSQSMLESDQFPTQGVVSVLNKPSTSSDLQHAWKCASRRGAVCDCGAWRTRIDPDLIHDHVGEEDLP